MQKRIIWSVVTITVIGMAPSMVSAAKYFNRGYLGVEVIQTNQNFKTGYGDKIFKKNPQNYSVFGGFNFSKNFGLEAGYEFQPNRSKDVTLVQGDYVPTYNGTGLVTAGQQILSQSGYKISDPYLGLYINTMRKRFEYKALIGAVFTHVNAQYTLNVYNTGVYTPPTIFRTFSHSRLVPMVKLITTGFVTPNFGIRVSFQYINMGQVRITSDQLSSTNTAPIIKLKDSYGIGIGLVYKFC